MLSFFIIYYMIWYHNIINIQRFNININFFIKLFGWGSYLLYNSSNRNVCAYIFTVNVSVFQNIPIGIFYNIFGVF